jgi:hypothetical protein
MKIFISWSGELSQLVALSVRTWIQNVIQATQPYVSSEDIEKGSRWFAEIESELDACHFGIICLTRENMNKPWILFEAGAMSRSITRARVTPLLIDLSAADLSGPLAQFQATTIQEDDMLRLAKNIGGGIGDPHVTEKLVERSFHKWWPDLQIEVAEIIESVKPTRNRMHVREDREILEEVLETNRTLIQLFSSSISEPVIPLRVPPQQLTVADGTTILGRIKVELEKRRKMMVVTALDKAANAYVEGALLYIEFEAGHEVIKQELEQPQKFTLLREICHQVTGRAMGIRVKIIGAEE